MEQSEIQRRNEAIAKYMGWKPWTVGEEPPNDGYFPPPGVGEATFYFTEDLDFHKEWELLMSVVERLSCEGWSVRLCERDSDGMYPCTISDMKGRVTLTGATLVSNRSRHFVEAVWLAVSDYVLSLEKSWT